jgi:hypothetical protein
VLFITIVLIALHSPDGMEILVNADEITMLRPSREAIGKPNDLVTGGVRCIIGLNNGKYISVVESCGMVREAINASAKEE